MGQFAGDVRAKVGESRRGSDDSACCVRITVDVVYLCRDRQTCLLIAAQVGRTLARVGDDCSLHDGTDGILSCCGSSGVYTIAQDDLVTTRPPCRGRSCSSGVCWVDIGKDVGISRCGGASPVGVLS